MVAQQPLTPQQPPSAEPQLGKEDAEEYTQALGQVVAGGWRQVALGERLGVPKALGITTREWVEQRLGGYVRLSIEDRQEAVAELTDGEGLSNVQAASVLGVSDETIRRDRDATNVEAELAQQNQAASGDATNVEPPPEPETPPLPTGRFRCIVIDPPWPIEKIERDVRPKQGRHVDYHVWSIKEVKDRVGEYLAEKADRTGCHVYLWTTHRHLPEAFKMLDAWGVRYQCLMTWRKNVGITPYSWMYDTEHVLFGRIGGLKLLENGLRLSFDASVTKHSEKPGVFYERVQAASPEPRLDLFAREHREGFTAWGNEIEQ